MTDFTKKECIATLKKRQSVSAPDFVLYCSHQPKEESMIRFTQPLWWPFSFRLGSPNGFAWCKLPANLYISWNLEPDWNERVVWERGPLNITRPETREEEQERLYAEEEAAYEEHCRSFYSY